MSEIKSSENCGDQKKTNKTWAYRTKSSLLISLIITGVWMVVAVAAGGWDPRGAEGLSGLLGNAFGIFIVLSCFTFFVKTIWHFIRKAKG